MPGRIVLKSKSKYRAVRTPVGSITFASKKEAARYLILKDMEKVGEIMALKLQPKFDLTIGKSVVCRYIGDFSYICPKRGFVVEDVKGMKTAVYRIKRKLMKALFNIDITEV